MVEKVIFLFTVPNAVNSGVILLEQADIKSICKLLNRNDVKYEVTSDIPGEFNLGKFYIKTTSDIRADIGRYHVLPEGWDKLDRKYLIDLVELGKIVCRVYSCKNITFELRT